MKEREQIIVKCLSVADLPSPPIESLKRPCGGCKKDVWITRATLETAEAAGTPCTLCMKCYALFAILISARGLPLSQMPESPGQRLERDGYLRRN